VKRKLEVHLARESLYDSAEPRRYPKLFVNTQGDSLGFGFYVEGDARPDFAYLQKFLVELKRESQLRANFRSALATHDLFLADYYRFRSGVEGGVLKRQFRSHNSTIEAADIGASNWKATTFEELCINLPELIETGWLDLHVFKQIDASAAIARGSSVIDDISAGLEAVASLYRHTIRSLTDRG